MGSIPSQGAEITWLCGQKQNMKLSNTVITSIKTFKLVHIKNSLLILSMELVSFLLSLSLCNVSGNGENWHDIKLDENTDKHRMR